MQIVHSSVNVSRLRSGLREEHAAGGALQCDQDRERGGLSHGDGVHLAEEGHPAGAPGQGHDPEGAGHQDQREALRGGGLRVRPGCVASFPLLFFLFFCMLLFFAPFFVLLLLFFSSPLLLFSSSSFFLSFSSSV